MPDGTVTGWGRSANGSLSLPRKLAVKNGKLYSQVIPQIQELFTEKAENGPYFLSMRKTKEIKESTVLSLAGSLAGKVNLYIGETALKLTLWFDGASKEKEDADAKEQALPFVCQIQTDHPVEEITAYVDKAIIELFINGGEQACTRRFYLPKAVLRPVAEKTGAWSIDIKGMRSIW